jgi:hypothetical protein
MMGEPRLEDIDDYNTLKGEKKKVVWAVDLAGILMGFIYSFVYSANDVEDRIEVQDSIKIMPVR